MKIVSKRYQHTCKVSFLRRTFLIKSGKDEGTEREACDRDEERRKKINFNEVVKIS